MKQVDENLQIMSSTELRAMILPLLAEQLLLVFIGLFDTMIVSNAGEAAVSGVSLVNQINMIFVLLFNALAAGGGVVISQYIGNKNAARASLTASQLVMFVGLFSIACGAIMFLCNHVILSLLFGAVEDDVMTAATTYLAITSLSYPLSGIYAAGASLYRCLGKTSTTMIITAVINVINIGGNLIGVLVLHTGVIGVAVPTVFSMLVQAIWISILCSSKRKSVRYSAKNVFSTNADIITKILRIAVPNGVEAGAFQLVKVLLSTIVAMFGTYQIAANGIAQTFWTLAASIGLSMGPVFITVIGRAMGDGNIAAAEYNFHRLLRLTCLLSLVWNLLIPLFVCAIMPFYPIEEETKELVIILILIHNIFNTFAFPFSSPLSNGLRATGDVRFTLMSAIVATVIVRSVLSWVFAVTLNMGVIGIAWAMAADWIVRGIMQYIRFRSGKWKKFKVI